MASRISRLVESIWQRGPLETMALVRKNIAHEFRWYLDRRFDRIYGTNTSDRIELTELDIAGGNREQGIYYEPTSTGLFRHMMNQVGSALHCEDFVFIDFGSGKGRTLMMASDYPFKAIVGVEFSRELHLTAQHNLSIYHGSRQQCENLSAIHSDASLFAPPAENLLVYFYNPFLKEVMTKVLANLTTLAHTRGVRIGLVYFNPLSGDVVENCGLFKRRLDIALPRDYTRELQRRCVAYFSWPDAPGSTIVTGQPLA
jgi:hypothetical protein